MEYYLSPEYQARLNRAIEERKEKASQSTVQEGHREKYDAMQMNLDPEKDAAVYLSNAVRYYAITPLNTPLNTRCRMDVQAFEPQVIERTALRQKYVLVNVIAMGKSLTEKELNESTDAIGIFARAQSMIENLDVLILDLGKSPQPN